MMTAMPNEYTVLLGTKSPSRASGPHKGIIALVIVTVLLGIGWRLRGQSQEAPYTKLEKHLGRVEPEKNELQTDLWNLQQLIKDMGREQREKELNAPSLSLRGGHLSNKTDAEVLQDVVNDMMQALQHKGDDGMRTVIANAAPSNPTKTQPIADVIKDMRDSNKAILLGKFVDYEIKKPKDNTKDHREVEVIVKAPFGVMHASGLHWADIGRDPKDKSVRTAAFRWRMLKNADSEWQLDGIDFLPHSADSSKA